MDRSLVDLLVDPVDKSPLGLCDSVEESAGRIVSGELSGATGRAYPIVDGIPRFIGSIDRSQQQTEQSFGYKWNRRETFDSPAMLQNMRSWLVEKYGFTDECAMRSYFSGRNRILDAGCGAGLSSSTWLDRMWNDESQQNGAEWYGVDISNAIDMARSRLGDVERTHYVQADVLQMPFRRGSFDTIFSEGVLHHSPSTHDALISVADLLIPGGEILFYVYRKKGPVREFTDDHIRDAISGMNPAEAWEALRPLTRLGEALANLNTSVDVPEDVPLLGIKAGEHDVQRLVYWNFAKMFWNDNLTFEENHHINFDWYHPKYAHRQTEEEVRSWCEEASLSISHLHAEESGFSVRAIRGN